MVSPPGPHRRLSPREVDVAVLLVSGMARRAVGDRLGISTYAVGGHVARACLKLGVTGGVRGLRAYLVEEAWGDLAALAPFAGRVIPPTPPGRRVQPGDAPPAGRS